VDDEQDFWCPPQQAHVGKTSQPEKMKERGRHEKNIDHHRYGFFGAEF
jgi:hypothetical protein